MEREELKIRCGGNKPYSFFLIYLLFSCIVSLYLHFYLFYFTSAFSSIYLTFTILSLTLLLVDLQIFITLLMHLTVKKPGPVSLMVYYLKPRPERALGKNGLYETLWKLSYCIWDLLFPIVLVSVPVPLSVNTPLDLSQWLRSQNASRTTVFENHHRWHGLKLWWRLWQVVWR